jgi:hypothetical protein
MSVNLAFLEIWKFIQLKIFWAVKSYSNFKVKFLTNFLADFSEPEKPGLVMATQIGKIELWKKINISLYDWLQPKSLSTKIFLDALYKIPKFNTIFQLEQKYDKKKKNYTVKKKFKIFLVAFKKQYGEEFWEFRKVVNFKSAFWKILDIDSCNRHSKALKSQFSDF